VQFQFPVTTEAELQALDKRLSNKADYEALVQISVSDIVRCSLYLKIIILLFIEYVTVGKLSRPTLGNFTSWISPSLSEIAGRNRCNSQASRSNYRGYLHVRKCLLFTRHNRAENRAPRDCGSASNW